MSNCQVCFLAGFITSLALANIDRNLLVEVIRWMYGVETDEPYDLVIGVLSARDHFRQRQAIRDTWLEDVKHIQDLRIKVWFVLGNSPCPIHPADRVDPYSCQEWKAHNKADEMFTAAVPVKPFGGFDYEVPGDFHRIPPTSKAYLDFKVRHPIVLRELGMLFWLHQYDTEVEVKLEDLNSQEEIVTVHFKNSDPALYHGDTGYYSQDPFTYTPTDHGYLLPKGFEGRITLSCVTCNDSLNSQSLPEVVLNSGGGVVSYPQDPSLNQSRQISTVSFKFSVHDIAALNHHISGIQDRQLTWGETLSDVQRRLTEEETSHGDILRVNLVDTYRNLPKKLLQFHKELQETSNQLFVMKTDDDCYLNIPGISRGLKGLKLTYNNNTWWSRFRDQWFVERWGKWKEMSYTTDVYPRFACGTGNIVSNDISQWLAENADSLHQFQGEDVSMGIWLAAKGVQYIQDDRWQCDNQCTAGALAVSELSEEELKSMWTNKNNCGNICTCD